MRKRLGTGPTQKSVNSDRLPDITLPGGPNAIAMALNTVDCPARKASFRRHLVNSASSINVLWQIPDALSLCDHLGVFFFLSLSNPIKKEAPLSCQLICNSLRPQVPQRGRSEFIAPNR